MKEKNGCTAQNQAIDNREHIQFIGTQEHNRVTAVLDVLAIFFVIFAPCAVDAFGTDRALAEESDWEHLLVTNDRRPWGMSLHPGKPVITGLDIGMNLNS